MTDNEIIRLLPTQPPREVYRAAADDPELNPSFITFKRVSVETGRIEWQELMTPEDFDRIAKASKRRWGALCHCTFCEENFYTGWHSHRDMSGPLMFIGDDENLYPGWTEDIDDGNQRIELAHGDQANCPMCGEGVTFVKYSAIKNGHKYQRLFTSIEQVGDLTAIVTWLAGSIIGPYGVEDEYIHPRDAAVLTENGFLRCYTRTRRGQYITCEALLDEWRRVKSAGDPMQKMYYSYDSVFGRTFGSEQLLTYLDFEGTSAEKTGLDEYLSAGGRWPYAYLKFWRTHKAIENLLKTGMHRFAACAIDKEIDSAVVYNSSMYRTLPATAENALSCVDWRKQRPHEMLGMTKTEYREARELGWTEDDLIVWQNYNSHCEKMSPAQFYDAIEFFGGNNIKEIVDNYICGEDTLLISELYKYGSKQPEREPSYTARLLIDYRRMLYDQPQRLMAFTYEELWPRDILTAHDRLAAEIQNSKNPETEANFLHRKQEYSPLEWTDGELCIVCPTSNADLVAEGKTLRHCVGGYGESHLSGKPIFFVRHYRRPERSYYTLNENLTGDKPRHIQLHGYGNEHHGEHKQHSHKIPQKVLDFCDRWEKEILVPWFAKQKAATAKKKHTKKENTA